MNALLREVIQVLVRTVFFAKDVLAKSVSNYAPVRSSNKGGASTTFVTPVSSPVNTLVVTPGNYKFGDFVKIGGPFALVVMALCVFLVPIVLPL